MLYNATVDLKVDISDERAVGDIIDNTMRDFLFQCGPRVKEERVFAMVTMDMYFQMRNIKAESRAEAEGVVREAIVAIGGKEIEIIISGE